MARKSMVELKADLLTAFPDNITGLITPQGIRDYFSSLIDAIRPAYGLISRASLTAQVLGVTDAPVVFDTGYVSDVPDYSTSPATGVIQRLEKGMTRVALNATLEGANGRLITITLYKDGVATPWRSSVSLLGAGKPVDVTIYALSYSGSAASFQIQAKADAAGTSVNFGNMDFLTETVPVNTY